MHPARSSSYSAEQNTDAFPLLTPLVLATNLLRCKRLLKTKRHQPEKKHGATTVATVEAGQARRSGVQDSAVPSGGHGKLCRQHWPAAEGG